MQPLTIVTDTNTTTADITTTATTTTHYCILPLATVTTTTTISVTVTYYYCCICYSSLVVFATTAESHIYILGDALWTRSLWCVVSGKISTNELVVAGVSNICVSDYFYFGLAIKQIPV